MEQKSLRLKRLGIVALVFLAIVFLRELVNFYIETKAILQYIEHSPYMSSPYQDVIVPENWFFGAFSGFISIILPPVKFVILGVVLLRIVRTGVPFSVENKKNLQLYGILEAVQSLISIFSWNFKFINILSFMVSCAIIVIWFCWPDSAEQNSNERGRKTARIYYIVMIGVQIAVVITNALYYFELWFTSFLNWSSFLFSATNTAYFAVYLFRCAYIVLFYNQIGRVFRSVGKGVSKFDPANIKRIKTAAWIRIIGAGISSAFSVLSIAKYLIESSLYTNSLLYNLSYVIDIVRALTVPLVLLCLAYAYEHGAAPKLESEPFFAAGSDFSGQPDIQIGGE